ncbi:hypothetical protein E3E12_03445 [Formicincola oecophyllae]|uniref:Sulfatase N-terminal domain-containing protein n=1 Tax=Formicincola oecophyllae TaxID=2558361 RepID=A0A4Y6U8B1_9PROT|nr:sulfatase-like hydrolase/transferase [Formicincola oecophyllae]QDH13414.1 hypothetical protein E3E12_03445 [Formicincola oecophyllae]
MNIPDLPVNPGLGSMFAKAGFATLLTLLSCRAVDYLALSGAMKRGLTHPLDSKGWWLGELAWLGLLGLFELVTGTWLFSTVCVVVLMGALAIASRVKEGVLREPLEFTDFILITNIIKHPAFYLDAVPRPLFGAAFLVIIGLVGFIIWQSTTALTPRFVGACEMVVGFGILWGCLRHTTIMGRNDFTRHTPPQVVTAHVQRHGMLATLLGHSLRWMEPRPASTPDPLNLSLGQEALPDLLLIVQGESWAEPDQIFTGLPQTPVPLPALNRIRSEPSTWWGDLVPSGFGAYTMRTEHGVLFGLADSQLAHRAFDPYMTAAEDIACALPNRLARYYRQRLFIHPHDLRFYNRDHLMPKAGFNGLVGPKAFQGAKSCGPYVSDKALGLDIMRRLEGYNPAAGRLYIHAVTMENHGPWQAGRAGAATALDAWLMHVRHSDDLLGELDQALEAQALRGHSGMLVFFGDHRPAFKECAPGRSPATRTTPWLIKRYPPSNDAHPDQTVSKQNVTLTPAALHKVILEALLRTTTARASEAAQ